MKALFATDGSTSSREGEALIRALMDPGAVTIHAFCVRQTTPQELPLPEAMWAQAGKDYPVFNPERIAEEAAERLAEHGFATTSSASKGDAPRIIEQELKEGVYDLVVLGASHTSWMGNILMGSVSTHVLHHAPCSVLITHKAPTGERNEILFATDGSAQAAAALDLAMKALSTTRCAFEVATAVRRPYIATGVYPIGPTMSDREARRQVEEERIHHGWELVGRHTADLRLKGFTAEGAVLSGQPAPQLLKEADNIGAALVVLGARGLGAVQRAFLGSVSDSVARHAPATLIVRTKSRSDGTSKPRIGDSSGGPTRS